MELIEGIAKSIDYIENNLTEKLSVDEIAGNAYVSPYYFQKVFSMLCGYTVGEYIRNRRLSLAGSELAAGNTKVIDAAIKYGYDSPDSFAKAFTRFHGATPSSVLHGGRLRIFSPLKIKISLEGGKTMDYRIVKKSAFTVIGVSKNFTYEEAYKEVPKFWEDFNKTEASKHICTMYGINNDKSMGGSEFEYTIADNYNPLFDIPEGLTTKVIPAHTWAVFTCKGAMPAAIQKTNEFIFSQWLPTNTEYEIAEGYNIEMYSDPAEYKNGTMDENYVCEVWIPVTKK